VTKNIIVSVGYKYIEPQKISYDSNIDGAAPPGIYHEDLKLKLHTIILGVAYLF